MGAAGGGAGERNGVPDGRGAPTPDPAETPPGSASVPDPVPAPDPPRLRFPAAGAAALVWALVAAFLAVGLVAVYQGWRLTHPPRQAVRGDPATDVSDWYRCLPYLGSPAFCSPTPLFTAEGHIPIRAWILPSVPAALPGAPQNWSDSTVILVPDHGQSRTPTDFPAWPVAQLLVAAGYNVVMYDPQGEGQSGGAGIGFGTVEVRDLLAVVQALHALGGPAQGQVAVWGVGTGADTAILAAARDPDIDAVIADSPYLSADGYLRRQIPAWTGLPAFPFGDAILWAMQRETGVTYSRYDVLAAAQRLGARPARPLLVVVGQADAVTPPAEARRLAQAAGSRAYLYVVPGARHLGAYAASPAEPGAAGAAGVNEYACLVLNTLKVMGRPTGSASPIQAASPCGGYPAPAPGTGSSGSGA